MAHAASARILSQNDLSESSRRNEAVSSGVSWAAVIAGAFVAVALLVILVALGTGALGSVYLPFRRGRTPRTIAPPSRLILKAKGYACNRSQGAVLKLDD